jgi:hypothetical protein
VGVCVYVCWCVEREREREKERCKGEILHLKVGSFHRSHKNQ